MNTPGNLVVLIKNLNHGGAQKVCITVCNELFKRNHNVELWILDYTATALSQKLNSNIKVTDLKSKQVRASIFKLATLLRKNKPSKLLVFNIELAILAILIKKMFFLNTFIIFRSINTLSHAYKFPESIWEKFFASFAIKKILPHSDKIIAQSTGMKNDLIRFFNFDESKIQTIFNPATILSKTETTDEDNQPDSRINFLYVGRLRAQKGLDNLIRIFSRVKNDIPEVMLTIVGEGPEKEKLINLAQSMGLTSSVNFIGYQPNPYPFFKRANATVLTSIYEGFPNVLVESIAAGTPVISFDCPSGPADIIEDGLNGFLVPDQDMEAFVKAMKMIAENKVTFQRSAIENSSKKFSVDTIIDRYEELIHS